MKKIDLKTWPRREHFKMFNAYESPHFGLCANVDITALYPFVKQRKVSFTIALVYLFSRVANEILEFRLRIHGDDLVEYPVVHPSPTLLVSEELFSFCLFEYIPEFGKFSEKAEETLAYVKDNPTLEDPPKDDNLLFMTSIPWVSFTSMLHPIKLNPTDSVPRIAWGKFFEQGERLVMPLNVQVHHAVMDGIHMGRYYENVQEYLDQPDMIFK